MLTWILVFLGSLVLLIISARFFTTASEKIGILLRMPPFVTGIFIVGIGTSLPELITGILSVDRGHSEIVPGNLIGSNISNLLLLLGAAVLFNKKDIVLGKRYLMIDLHYLLGASALLFVFMYDGELKLVEGLIGIAVFLLYSLYLIKAGNDETGESATQEKPSALKNGLILLTCGVGIYFGAEYTVTSITEISTLLEISPSIIALTVLSVATTLPELAVNYFSIRKGQSEMAVGNILGSCIFNALVIPGVAAAFGSITVSPQILAFPLPVLPVATLFFYLLTQDKRISVWEGGLFLLLYAVFILKSAALV